MSSELAVVEAENVGALMRRSTDVAGVCGGIVKSTAVEIQGRKYVKVEGWQSIAVAFNCVASSRNVEKVDGGYRAIGEVRRMSDGAVLAAAEGFVGEDEPVWYGGGHNKKTGKPYEKRSVSAIRCMAQTRSISRACRSAFAFIVTMIDSKLSTTPFEEMDFEAPSSVEVIAAPPQGVAAMKQRLLTVTAPATVSEVRATREPEEPPHTIDAPQMAARQHLPVTFRYGGSKGKTSFEVDDADLDYYIAGAEKSVNDPSKARFVAANTHELGLLQAEKRYRGGVR